MHTTRLEVPARHGSRQIEHDVPRTKQDWGWNWSEVKIALEWLFYTGRVTATRRNTAFELVIPADVPTTRTPTEQELRLLREVIDPGGAGNAEVRA